MLRTPVTSSPVTSRMISMMGSSFVGKPPKPSPSARLASSATCRSMPSRECSVWVISSPPDGMMRTKCGTPSQAITTVVVCAPTSTTAVAPCS